MDFILELKEKIDIIGKRIDILHKKALILLGAVAGSWFYGLEFLDSDNLFTNLIGIVSLLLFNFFTVGLIMTFLKLNRLDEKLERLENGMDGDS
jgi:hypothetical protein